MGFFTAVRAYGRALDILFSRKFWWFLLFPALLSVLLFWGMELLAGMAGDSLYRCAESMIQAWVADISWLQWVGTATGIFIRFVLRLLSFFFFVTFGGYLVMVFMSPVYSWLSERVEAHLSGREYAFSFRQLLWEISRGIAIALRSMLLQLLLSLLFFFLSFLPVVGLLSPLLVFFTSAYFYGFTFMDYSIERRHFSVKKSFRYMARNMGAVTGIGSVFAISLMIPGFSMAACCFVSLLAVIAGAVLVEEQGRRQGGGTAGRGGIPRSGPETENLS